MGQGISGHDSNHGMPSGAHFRHPHQYAQPSQGLRILSPVRLRHEDLPGRAAGGDPHQRKPQGLLLVQHPGRQRHERGGVRRSERVYP